MQRSFLSLAAVLFAAALFTGCDNKEDVLEVETPDGSLDVERDKDTGAVDVDVE